MDLLLWGKSYFNSCRRANEQEYLAKNATSKGYAIACTEKEFTIDNAFYK